MYATPFDFYFADWYILHTVILIGDCMVKSGLNQHRIVLFSPMGIDSADNSLLAYGEICIDKSHLSPINPAQQKYRYSSVPIEVAVLVRKRTTFLLQAWFSAEAGILPGTLLWAYTGRGEPFCFKLASLQRQECFPGLASGLIQEEESLSV